MAQGGSNGAPHADYSRARDETEMDRAIAHAHRKGMRVGLYMRGIERYGLDAQFFEKHCQRDRDGIYLDWHGAHAIAYHESTHAPEASLGDVHFSSDGSVLPAKAYFDFASRLRSIVGPEGFLIGHQGTFAAGVLPNLGFDAYLAGESPPDHAMLDNIDNAVWRGMLGGGACTPWPVDAPQTFTTPSGIAKMAAWGLFVDVPLGINGFATDPNDSANAYPLRYWRILAAGGANQATLFGSPSSAAKSIASSSPSVRGSIYESGSNRLVIASNVSPDPASATLSGAKVAGAVARIDAMTGTTAPSGQATGALDTGMLAPWEIAGWLVQP
jgi:hypothetical protein